MYRTRVGVKYEREITAPPSKSYLQRAIAIAILSDGITEIFGYQPSDDVYAAIRAAVSLGARIEIQPDKLMISPAKPKANTVEMDCGEAGLSTRMFSPVAALFEQEVILTGKGSLLNRPMDMVEEALVQLGKEVESNQGKLPLKLKGKLTPGTVFIDGSESSQLLTGLLIALPLLPGDSLIEVKNLKSVPYVQMTLEILAHFGVHIVHEDYRLFRVAGNQKPQSRQYLAEGDWSGAAFHLVGGAIAGRVAIKGLHPHSAQADKAILNALNLAGAHVQWEGGTVTVSKNELNPFRFDATHCPDLFPPLAVLAATCVGESEITGTDRLFHKESNRALTLREELGKMGVHIKLEDNLMRIEGGGKITGAKVSSRNDHRIAMAAAILSLVAEREVEIENPEAVNKSYPGFYKDFEGS